MTLAEIIANANANSEFVPGMSSNELFFGTSTDDRLTDVIADVAEACLGKADTGHTHDGYAATGHGHSYNDLSDKPTIPAAYTHPASHPASMISGLAEVATTGSYDDLTDKPTIPAAYTHPASHPASMITGLAEVATTGSY